jgi:hypothetical protein
MIRHPVHDRPETSVSTCAHEVLVCLNPYEFIRKYRCARCQGVMMCRCEEPLARRFLPHQIREGRELETQRRISVTLGFQPAICNSCRGLPEESYPRAATYGRSSKIERYYWREIWFETMRRFCEWADQHGVEDPFAARGEHKCVRKQIERQVINEMRELHHRAPKYEFRDESQSQVIADCSVRVLNLDGTYVKHAERKALLLHDGQLVTAEDLASRHFEQQGFSVMRSESIPFHALFGVYLWLLIQDPFDPRVRIVGFGQREPAEGQPRKEVWAHLPEDLGTPGYARRRADAIDKHFTSMLSGDTRDLLWTFDYWTHHSSKLREYLWAHRQEDIARARKIVTVLPADTIRRILRYLLTDYWRRFCGWPDLFAYKPGEHMFAEVKSSGDELSEDQKRWIRGNSTELHLPFTLVKIHRKRTIEHPEAPTAAAEAGSSHK